MSPWRARCPALPADGPQRSRVGALAETVACSITNPDRITYSISSTRTLRAAAGFGERFFGPQRPAAQRVEPFRGLAQQLGLQFGLGGEVRVVLDRLVQVGVVDPVDVAGGEAQQLAERGEQRVVVAGVHRLDGPVIRADHHGGGRHRRIREGVERAEHHRGPAVGLRAGRFLLPGGVYEPFPAVVGVDPGIPCPLRMMMLA